MEMVLIEKQSFHLVMDLVQMQQFVCVDSQKKDILILGEGPTQVLDGAMLTAEKNIQLILLKIISFV